MIRYWVEVIATFRNTTEAGLLHFFFLWHVFAFTLLGLAFTMMVFWFGDLLQPINPRIKGECSFRVPHPIVFWNWEPILPNFNFIIVFWQQLRQFSHFLIYVTIYHAKPLSQIIDSHADCLSYVSDRSILTGVGPCIGIQMEKIKDRYQNALSHQHVGLRIIELLITLFPWVHIHIITCEGWVGIDRLQIMETARSKIATFNCVRVHNIE